MRFGLFGTAQADRGESGPETGQGFRDYLDFNVEGEVLGLHSSFLVEHHFTGWNQVSATLTLLTALAMRTTTLRLGSGVMVLPWHHPVLLAEQAATLDLISGGRLDFGVGKGYRHSEFKGFGVAPEEAQARFEEALDVILRSWTSRERFSHHGRFWQLEDIVVEPPPAQQPHPPIWVAAASAPSIRRAAARGFNLILDQYAAPEAIGERIALYRAEREASGQKFDPMQVAVARQVYVAKNEADKHAALERLAKYTQRAVDVSRAPEVKGGSHVLAYADGAGGTETNALYGTPDQICGKLHALNRAGAKYLLLTIAGGAKEQLRRFAREIMPEFSHARSSAPHLAGVSRSTELGDWAGSPGGLSGQPNEPRSTTQNETATGP
jgi:alkanesulfonate monooxygenase SsuD/methylene tetrahydromethanopterin reductase-like flavin-dependent oxidoreductase (luciferase family)